MEYFKDWVEFFHKNKDKPFIIEVGGYKIYTEDDDFGIVIFENKKGVKTHFIKKVLMEYCEMHQKEKFKITFDKETQTADLEPLA